MRVSRRAQISGIVIAAIDHNSLVPVQRANILMAPTLNAVDFSSTAFAVHKVDCFPDTAIPCVVTNAEGTSQRVSGLDRIDAGLSDLG